MRAIRLIEETIKAPTTTLDNIKLLARIMFWAGWVSLALGIVLTVASVVTLPQGMMGYDQLPPGMMISQPSIMMIGSTLYGVMFSLGLFFGWGVLTVLCRISDQMKSGIEPRKAAKAVSGNRWPKSRRRGSMASSARAPE